MPLAYSIRAMADSGLSFEGLTEVFQSGFAFCAIGQLADKGAHLVDDFRMVGAQRGMRVGVPGLQLERLLQACLDYAAQALRQRLEHGDSLAVAPERVCVQIKGIGVPGLEFLQFLAARHDFLIQLELARFGFLQVIGVDVGCLLAAL